MGQPELLITGVSAETSARLLNSIAHQMADGDVELRPGTHIDFQSEFLFEVVEVEHPDVHLKCAVGLFGARIRAFQLVWADKRRRWPWIADGTTRAPSLCWGGATPQPCRLTGDTLAGWPA